MPMESYTYYDEVVKASLSDMGLQFLVFCGRRICLPLCRLYMSWRFTRGISYPNSCYFHRFVRLQIEDIWCVKKSLFKIQ